MNNLAQASYGGTWIFLALGIAIGLVALAAWVSHRIWFFSSFGLFPAFTSSG
jgi:flagellar biogenesis protein FliO